MNNDEDDIICRICRWSGDLDRQLIYPCKCAGTIKYVHEDCLLYWLRYTSKKRCEVCNHCFKLDVVYTTKATTIIPMIHTALCVPIALGKKLLWLLYHLLILLSWVSIPIFTNYAFQYVFRNEFFDGAVKNFEWDNVPRDLVCGMTISMLTSVLIAVMGWIQAEMPEANFGFFRLIFSFWSTPFWNLKKTCTYHVLNIIFICILLYCPYMLGNMVIIKHIYKVKLKEPTLYIYAVVNGLLGYALIFVKLLAMQTIARKWNFVALNDIIARIRKVVRTVFLTTVDVCLLPTLYGWWINNCTKYFVHKSVKMYISDFSHLPAVSILLHWSIGILFYMHYMSFCMILRLLFKSNIIERIQKYIKVKITFNEKLLHMTLMSYLHHIIVSGLICGFLGFLIFFSICELKVLIFNHIDGNVNTITLEITIIWLMRKFRMVRAAKGMHKFFKNLFSAFGIPEEMLLKKLVANGGNVIEDRPPVQVAPTAITYLSLRILGIILSLCLCLFLVVFMFFFMHMLITFENLDWLVTVIYGNTIFSMSTVINIISTIYFAYYFRNILINMLFVDRMTALHNIKDFLLATPKKFARISILTFILATISWLHSIMLDLYILTPIIVPYYETSVLYSWCSFPTSLHITMIYFVCVCLGPENRLKHALRHIGNIGILEIEILYVLKHVAAPIMHRCTLMLAVPYVLSRSIFPIFFTNFEHRIIIAHYIYIYSFSFKWFAIYGMRRFIEFYRYIKLKKYTLGVRFINYGAETSGVPIKLKDVPKALWQTQYIKQPINN